MGKSSSKPHRDMATLVQPLAHIPTPGDAVGTLSFPLWMFAPGASLCLLFARSWRQVAASGHHTNGKEAGVGSVLSW